MYSATTVCQMECKIAATPKSARDTTLHSKGKK